MAAAPDTVHRGVRILIVDDHTVVRWGCRDILAAGLDRPEILEAADTGTALTVLREQRLDLVILDINLPGRSGFDVLTEARRLCPGTPVLVLSGYPEEAFAIRAFKLGAAGYLNKQAASDELVVAVRRALDGGRYVSATMAEKCAAALGGGLALAPHEALSGRELQVLQSIARGMTLKEIASAMSLSEKTIATYRARISQKMALSSNVELTRYALHHHLVD